MEKRKAEMENLLHQVALHDYKLGSSYKVLVTHIHSPEDFYVRPIPYRYYLNTLQTPGDPVNVLDFKAPIVIFKSDIENKFVRGELINTKMDEQYPTCTIMAIDYGFEESQVPVDNIFKTTYEECIPPLASRCRLADCRLRPDVPLQKATDAMRSYCGPEPAEITVRAKSDVMTVELVNSLSDIATLLALTEYTTLCYPGKNVNRLGAPAPKKQYFVFKQLNIGDKLHVRVLSGKSLESFFVADMKDFKNYQREEGNFTYFMRKQRALHEHDLKVGEPIAVRHDVQGCRYERALVKALVGPDRAKVLLVDMGTTIEVNHSQLKPMSEKFFYNPPAAIYCTIEKSQLWDNNLQRSLAPSCEFLMTIKELGKEFDEPYIVHLQKLK